MASRRRIGPVERAARKDLRGFGAEYAKSAVGMAYLDAATRLDCNVPPTDRDAVALMREMRLLYLTLAELSPPAAGGDSVDEFTLKYEERMKRLA
jgi:hypothetical protein